MYGLLLAFFSKFWLHLSAVLVASVIPVLIKLVKAVGFGVVSYVGFEFIFTQLETFIYSRFSGLPVDILNILLLARLDDAIAILFACASASLGLKIAAGSFTRGRFGGSPTQV